MNCTANQIFVGTITGQFTNPRAENTKKIWDVVQVEGKKEGGQHQGGGRSLEPIDDLTIQSRQREVQKMEDSSPQATGLLDWAIINVKRQKHHSSI